MKSFDWSLVKNEWLRKERGVSFEEIVFHLTRGDMLDVLDHPNQERHPGQRLFIVNMDGYAWVVPFAEDEETIFLKTGIPSRKMTKVYLGGV